MMDYQLLVNISVGIIVLLGGWVFKLTLSHISELKGRIDTLLMKHVDDMDEIHDRHTKLALSLPEKYLTKSDFNSFSERMNHRFDRLEEKIDDLKKTNN